MIYLHCRPYYDKAEAVDLSKFRENPDACKEARDHVLARMEEEKMITAETRDRLIALPPK